jgi:hypothetical protein
MEENTSLPSGPDGIGNDLNAEDIHSDWNGAPDGDSPEEARAEDGQEGEAPESDDAAKWPDDDSDIGDDDGDGTFGGEEKREADQSFTLKHLGEMKTVGRDEVIALAQKGLDYDRQRQKNEELTARNSTLTTEAASHGEAAAFLRELAAKNGMSVGQLVDLTRAEIVSRSEGIPVAAAAERLRTLREAGLVPGMNGAAARPVKTPEQAAAEKRDADVREFLSEYRDIDPKSIPQEVWQSVAGGRSLLSAYQSWELKKLRSDSWAAAKNAENREKSAGSRLSVGSEKHRDMITADWYS